MQNADGTGTARIDFRANGSWRSGHVHIKRSSAIAAGTWRGPPTCTSGARSSASSWTTSASRQRSILPPVRTDELDYELPAGLIAQKPAEPRDSARLLVYERATGAIRHRPFADLPGELRPDDLVVVNDTRVLPVRVHARRATGGAVEVLLLERRPTAAGRRSPGPPGACATARRSTPRARPSWWRGFHEGRVLSAVEGARLAPTCSSGWGRCRCRRTSTALGRPRRYQTVYARPGSAAAPTAGLHFTAELLGPCGPARGGRRDARGRPRHVPAGDRRRPGRPRAPQRGLRGGPGDRRGRRRAAAGAGSSPSARPGARPRDGVGAPAPRPRKGGRGSSSCPGTRSPPRRLVTNFHLPRSTLLALVMAFAASTRCAASTAPRSSERYRFYSFGDAMLLA